MADYFFKDHKPSAMQGEARLRGRERTYASAINGAFRLSVLIRYAPLAVGLKPSAMQGEARLRGLERIMYSKTISPRLARAKPACAGESGHMRLQSTARSACRF